ncbi:MAG: GAF domain-containing protein [Terriglobales bacterium]
MKRYRSPRDVLAEVDKVLAGRATVVAPFSLLDQTLDVLYRARHYSWIAIHLNAGEQSLAFRQAFRGSEPDSGSAPTGMRFTTPIRIGRRVLGAMEAESDREYAFGRDERVLLERVATRIALYLATRGKHILRRLRDQAQPSGESALAVAAEAPQVPSRLQPVSTKKAVKPSKSVSKSFGRAGLRPASGVTS